MFGFQDHSSNTPKFPIPLKSAPRKPLAKITNANRNFAYPPAEKMFFQKAPQERSCVKFQPEFDDDIVDDNFFLQNCGCEDW